MLLNQDAKILTTILAKRLNTFITTYIHQDQIGFMPGREPPNNIRKSLNVINYSRSYKIISLILSLDIEKAFDTLEFSFLCCVLRWVLVLTSWRQSNTCIQAQIFMLKSVMSACFTPERSTWEGCPLLPLLFVIVLQASAIHQYPGIVGVPLGNKEIKLIVLHFSNPQSSLPAVLDVLDHFGHIPGLWVNTTKTESYPISLTNLFPLLGTGATEWLSFSLDQQSLASLGSEDSNLS